MKRLGKFASVMLVVMTITIGAYAATVSTRHFSRSRENVNENAGTQKRMKRLSRSRRVASPKVAKTPAREQGGRKARLKNASVAKGSRRAKPARYVERFTGNSFASDQTAGDITAGEDPIVRQAAIEALGDMNGTVVAIDPRNGRILAMVNQRLALSSGAEPCSTIKVSVALAALSEGVVTKDTPVNVGGWKLNMTQALAHSNNQYFEEMGRRLGFQKVAHYAHQFGLGELAGWNIPGEHLGTYPSEELPVKLGGVGRMCSFGESINMTPLQLGALMSAVANGGTLYYLQHPTRPEQVANFQPKVKRYLNIRPFIPEISEGMAGAVQYGTARSLRVNFSEEQVLGKTGTCSNNGTRYGWFASFANTQYGRIVTVIFLEGGRSTFGPKAAELSGKFYRGLYDRNYFASRNAPVRTEGYNHGIRQ